MKLTIYNHNGSEFVLESDDAVVEVKNGFLCYCSLDENGDKKYFGNYSLDEFSFKIEESI